MAKKHYPKQNSSAPPPTPAGLEALETRAREDLAAGKFRKARESFKLLCKQDRERFLPGLIEANIRLMDELMERGLISEGEQVLEYLKTIAPPGILAGLDVRSRLQRADWTGALASAAKALAETSVEPKVAADALVLAFEHVDAPDAPALPDRVKSELAAMTGALEQIAREEYGAAQDLLRPLARDSMFADWKMLIKGMAAFHTGDVAKAEALLSRIPEDGAPGRAGAAYRALAIRKAPRDEVGMERVCRLFGVENLAPAVARADRLWRSGSLAESYAEMRKLPDFPTEEPGLLGALSDFYFKCFSALRGNLANRFYHSFDERVETGRCKSDAELRLICLALIREDLKAADFDSPETVEYLRQFLEHSSPHDSQARKMAAIVFEKLGSHHASLAPKSVFGFGRERMLDPKQAEKFLLESIEHDEDYLPAYLRLAEVYDFAKKTAERNRLLDEMTRRFPNEKAVLIKAGILCGQRKAYSKAIEYLERARALDPLDQQALHPLVTTYIGFAAQEYKKGALGKARNTYEILFKIADREKVEPALGFDFMLARQSIMERFFGEPEAAARLETTAREAAHSKPALIYFMHVYFRAKGASGKPSPFWDELQQTRPMNPLEALDLLHTFGSMREVCKDLDLHQEVQFIERSIELLLKDKANVNDIVQILKLLPPEQHPFGSLAEKLIAAGLKREPANPRLRLLRFTRRMDRIPNPDLARHELEKLQEDAALAGDTQTEKMAGELMRNLRLNDPFASALWDPDIDDDDDDFLDEDEAGGLPQNAFETMQALASMGPVELRMFRQKMLGMGMPEALLDDLIESARTGLPPKGQFPSMPQPPPKNPFAAPMPKQPPVSKPGPRRLDDNQPELF